MSKKVIYILAVFIAVTMACNSPYTIKDNGRTVELQLDSPFEIELEGNPTTGYVWQVVEIDTSVVRQEGQPAYQRSDDVQGAGGIYTFRFRTVAEGKTPLVLIYSRPFESDKEPVKTFRIKVISGTVGRITAE